MVSEITIISILIILLSVPPSIILYRTYKQTHIMDFVLWFFIIVCVSGSLIFETMFQQYSYLLVLQIDYWLLNTGYYLILVHAIRIRQVSIKNMLGVIGSVWYIILMLIIVLWETFEQPDSAFVLLWEMDWGYVEFHPAGAGLLLDNGTILYSTSYLFLGNLYYLFVCIVWIISYMGLKPINPTRDVIRAKRLWRISSVVILTSWISFLPFINLLEIAYILSIVGFGAFILVIIIYPQSMLLTHVQLMRAIDLYHHVQNKDTRFSKYIDNQAIVTYLQSIDPGVLDDASKM